MVFLFVEKNCHAKKYHYEYPGHVSVESFSSSQRRRVARTLQTTFPNIVTSSSGPTLSPIAFGADPTGEQDSSLAMTRMVTYLMSNVSSTKDESRHTSAPGIGKNSRIPDSRFDDPKKCRFFPVIFPLITRIPGIETKAPLFSRRKNLCG